MLAVVILVIVLRLSAALGATRNHNEAWYQAEWCNSAQGRLEVVLEDMARIDCLTDTHAVEFDFGKKWAEAIGQSMHYAKMTGKRGGIVLILEAPADVKYLTRIENIVVTYDLPIDVWVVKSTAY